MEIQGKIIEIFETIEVSDRFRKREFVVEYVENPQYPEFLKFEAVQEKCELLDQFNMGDIVEITFNLKGRRWNSPQGDVKYFVSLQAWKLLTVNQNTTVASQTVETVAPPHSNISSTQENADLPPVEAYDQETVKVDEDDLPF